MIRAINAWTFPGKMTFEDCFEKAKEIGFEGIEFNMDAPVPEAGNHCFSCKSTEEDFAKVRELIKKYGIQVQSLACSTYVLFEDYPPSRGWHVTYASRRCFFVDIRN